MYIQYIYIALWPNVTLRMSGCVNGSCCTTCAWESKCHVYQYEGHCVSRCVPSCTDEA